MRGLFVALALGLVAVPVSLAYSSINSINAYALDEHQCLSCHGDPELTKTTEGGEISLYVKEPTLNISAHRFIDCTTCHTSEPHNVPTPLTKLSLAEKCGSCHQYEYKLHLESIHGQQLAQGNSDVATCVDCHSSEGNPHSVIRVLEYDAPAYRKNIARTCANCHGNEELMSRYGILEKVYETYMRSFHGKALQLGTHDVGQLDKATCINCHGFHDIKSTADPESPVAGVENLARTCEQCHPGAGVEFAGGFLGHRDVSRKNSPEVFYTEWFFTILRNSVIGLGVVVVALASIRWGSSRWRE